MNRPESLVVFFLVLFLAATAYSQSTSQDFPTPITSSEVLGKINARDLGDSRLTSHFYLLEAAQGDLFVNLVTSNFTGDVDIFTLSNLQPLAKIVTYADYSESETGRVLYFRKPEKMLVRVRGRTPGDDPATYRIKFGGSFVASKAVESPASPNLPRVTEQETSGIRVNSVGTIIGKPQPVPTDIPSEEKSEVAEAVQPRAEDAPPPEDQPAPQQLTAEPAKQVEVVVSEGITAEKADVKEPAATPPANRTRERRSSRRTSPAARAETESKVAPDPMANIHLVILFKDGKKIERVMSEVFRFSVDRGVLTVVAKDGSIGRYPILDVAKVTIE